MLSSPVIFHIDVNSAFLSWKAVYQKREQGSMVDLREIPSAIGGDEESRHGIILAKSIPAKHYGVRTGESIAQARRKCPCLVVVPPDFSLYVRCSAAFLDILKEYAPKVEPFSIDEAFCDMTGTELLYGDLVAFAHKLKDEIHERLGFTVNIGVSTNKLLAKMASDFEKPDRVHTLFPEEIPEKMWPLPVDELLFVGISAREKLRHLGIRTIGDLAASDRRLIASHLKKHGKLIWDYANGIDDRPVVPEPSEPKYIGNSVTLSHDVTDEDEIRQTLLSLTETVAARLRADKRKASCITVQLTDHNFMNSSHQDTLPAPSNSTTELYALVLRLFHEFWTGTPIRLLGVAASRLAENAPIQSSLFDRGRSEKLSKLDAAVDQIREKFGEDAVKRACFLDSEREHMTGGLNRAKRRASLSDSMPDAYHQES